MNRIFAACALICILTVGGFGQTSKSKPRPRRKPKTTTTETKPMTPAQPSNTVVTPSGLTVTFTKRGTGTKPQAGQTVSVHYTGLLTDGTKFDSSKDRNDPISFPLGMGRVIKGWDEGIAMLGVGDQAILVIPPSIGYGERGAGGVIPPNATLVFIVELVAVK